jgi:hypothetical protein
LRTWSDRIVVFGLVQACAGCGAGRGGPPADVAGEAIAQVIRQRDAQIVDATLAGRFVLESGEGSVKGSLRIRYIRPDIYRVDVLAAGVAGAGGGSSFFVEGDSLLVYSTPGRGTESASFEETGVVTFLEEFDLGLADLKTLVISGAYLDLMSLSQASISGVRGGYVLEAPGASGDRFTIWINKDKEAASKCVRASRDGLPIVEVTLSKFKSYEGAWRPTRRVVRHFGQKATLAVQYDRIVLNGDLDPRDLYIRKTAS